MGTLLGFAPFVAFALVERWLGIFPGLLAGAVVVAVLLVRARIRGQTPKLLELGSLILFGGLAIYSAVRGPSWSIVGVRLAVDVGLLIIIVASLALRRPFTLQYAREQVPREVWAHPLFTRVNYLITAVWALALVVIVSADLIFVYLPQIPFLYGIVGTAAALIAATLFSTLYPKRVRERFRAQQP